MSKTFVTGAGKSIVIGRELGKGGEGAVFEVHANPQWVAKLYNAHHLPDEAKQAKLRFMATTADTELLSYAAWPQETLHTTARGPVIGFLMSKVSDHAPIHMLYSPARRRQDYPQAAWDFLLFAARNTASAFDAIHHHGHVLGDVNQGNALVGADSKVVLIDTDSFQIDANGAMHLCKVGVAHFTPPELQGIASFDSAPRTRNHDNFGLAVLIFHILFGGRHPYSGVPLRKDAGDALEKDIGAFRYAYAPDGQRRGFNPPPNSIPISIVPDNIQSMFTLAFTENGAKQSRPTSKQWVTALDGLRTNLKRCASTPMHVYPGHLGRCPWCTLEDSGVIYFLDVRIGVVPNGNTNFVLARVWASIEAVLPPPRIAIPNISAIKVTPTPLPSGVNPEGIIVFFRFVIVVVSLGMLSIVREGGIVVLGLALWAFLGVGAIGRDKLNAERKRRATNLYVAKQTHDQLVAQIGKKVDPEAFAKKKHELTQIRDEYQKLPEREKSEIANLYATAEARQKHNFLERYFLDDASIYGVGPAKKATLKSFGIETAADVTFDKVMRVKGFGSVLTSSVVDWRKSCERKFVFSPNLGVSDSDKNAVRAKIATRKRALENILSAGAYELQRLRQEMISKAQGFIQPLQLASQQLAQAQADLKAL